MYERQRKNRATNLTHGRTTSLPNRVERNHHSRSRSEDKGSEVQKDFLDYLKNMKGTSKKT